LHNAIQRFLIANGRGSGKRRCLARELVKNAGVV
jgi:hypothetical protein